MSVANYKIFQWGNPVGNGVMGCVYVAVSGVAKAANDVMPYTVANELICADIARALKLPVPPSFLVHDGENKPYHVSLNFHLSGEDLPPADVVSLASDYPELACGVILFDVWVCNTDRHPGNLAYDKSTRNLALFDHSHCFLWGGKEKLASYKSKIGVEGHCLAAQIADTAGFKKWYNRIKSVPDFYIQEAIQQTVGIGPMTEADSSFCCEFLLERRNKLLELIQDNAGLFPKIDKAHWDALKGA